MKYAGELAALGTAMCWAMGSNLFAGAGQRMGSAVLNRLRITTAFVLLALTLLVTRGAVWPVWATGRQTVLLALSGLIGFVFGDRHYFRSLVILGPGRASLLASTAPVVTVLLALPLLGEKPGPLALLGMALTLGGLPRDLGPPAPGASPAPEGSGRGQRRFTACSEHSGGRSARDLEARAASPASIRCPTVIPHPQRRARIW